MLQGRERSLEHTSAMGKEIAELQTRLEHHRGELVEKEVGLAVTFKGTPTVLHLHCHKTPAMQREIGELQTQLEHDRGELAEKEVGLAVASAGTPTAGATVF